MLLCYFSAALKSCIFQQTTREGSGDHTSRQVDISTSHMHDFPVPDVPLIPPTGKKKNKNLSPSGACTNTLCYVTWCRPRRSSEMFLCLTYQFCMMLQVTKKHFYPSETPLCGYNAAMLGMLGVTPRSLFLIPRHVHFFCKSCSSAVT